MGLRQTLNENPVVTSAIVGVITLGAIFMVGRQACGGGPDITAGIPTKAYYSSDEGKSKFVDDAKKIAPFKDKDGKEAYRVVVYKCPDGKEIVNHLERYPEDQRAAIEASGGPTGSMLGQMAKEIKRPGDKAWVTMKTPDKFAKVASAKCAGGTIVTPP